LVFLITPKAKNCFKTFFKLNSIVSQQSYLQQAQIERAKTSVLVNQVILNDTKVMRTAEAKPV